MQNNCFVDKTGVIADKNADNLKGRKLSTMGNGEPL